MKSQEKQILDLIRKEIKAALRAPGLIMKPQSIEAIARRVASELLQPQYLIVTTTDATETEIKDFPIEDGESGMIEIKVIGLKDDSSEANFYDGLIAYKKTGGTITITPLHEDSHYDTAGANVEAANASDESIKIYVTGAAATNIDWDCYTVKINKTATALP